MIEKLRMDGGMWLDESGVSWDSKAAYLQIEILGLCGCGNPDEIMAYIKTMLQRIDNSEYGDYTDMPYMFFVYWADSKGFTDHGTTVRCSWLTDKGKELLRDIASLEADL